MAKAGQRKCMSCGEFFIPDHRSGERQRCCAAAARRRASKATSQAAWLAQPASHDYFRGPVHVPRVQTWRTASRLRPRQATTAITRRPLTSLQLFPAFAPAHRSPAGSARLARQCCLVALER